MDLYCFEDQVHHASASQNNSGRGPLPSYSDFGFPMGIWLAIIRNRAGLGRSSKAFLWFLESFIRIWGILQVDQGWHNRAVWGKGQHAPHPISAAWTVSGIMQWHNVLQCTWRQQATLGAECQACGVHRGIWESGELSLLAPSICHLMQLSHCLMVRPALIIKFHPAIVKLTKGNIYIERALACAEDMPFDLKALS